MFIHSLEVQALVLRVVELMLDRFPYVKRPTGQTSQLGVDFQVL